MKTLFLWSYISESMRNGSKCHAGLKTGLNISSRNNLDSCVCTCCYNNQNGKENNNEKVIYLYKEFNITIENCFVKWYHSGGKQTFVLGWSQTLDTIGVTQLLRLFMTIQPTVYLTSTQSCKCLNPPIKNFNTTKLDGVLQDQIF